MKKQFETTFKLVTPTVSEKKLRKAKRIVNYKEKWVEVCGYAYKDEERIVLDPRQSDRDYLDTMIHEHLHCYLPDLCETHIARMSTRIANQLWKKNFRRIQK